MDFNLMISTKGNDAFFRDEKSDNNSLDNSFLRVGDESYSFKDILDNSDIEKLEPKITSDSTIGDQDLKYIGKLLKDKKDLVVAKLQEIKRDPIKNVQLELRTKKELERLNIAFSFISSSALEKESKISNSDDNTIYSLESEKGTLTSENVSDNLNISIEKKPLGLFEINRLKAEKYESQRNDVSNVRSSESLVLISNKINTKITSMIENKAIISGIDIYGSLSKNKADQSINHEKVSKLRLEPNSKSNNSLNQISSEQTSNNKESKLNRSFEVKTSSLTDSNVLKPVLPEKTFFVSKVGKKAFYKDINKLTADTFSHRNFFINSESKNALPEHSLKDSHINVKQVGNILDNNSDFIYSELGKNFINSVKRYEENTDQDKKNTNISKKYIKPNPVQETSNIYDNSELIDNPFNSEIKINDKKNFIQFDSKLNTNEVINEETRKNNDEINVQNKIKTISSESKKEEGNVNFELYNSFIKSSRRFILNLNETNRLSNISTVFTDNTNKVNNEVDKNDKPQIKKALKSYDVLDSSITDGLKNNKKSLTSDKKIVNENNDLSNISERKNKFKQNNIYDQNPKEINFNLKEDYKKTEIEKKMDHLDDRSFTLSSKFVSKSKDLEGKKPTNVLDDHTFIKNNTKLTNKETISTQEIKPYISDIRDSEAIGVSSSGLNINKAKGIDNSNPKNNKPKADIKELTSIVTNSSNEKEQLQEINLNNSSSDVNIIENKNNLSNSQLSEDLSSKKLNNHILSVNDPVNLNNDNKISYIIKGSPIITLPVQDNGVENSINREALNNSDNNTTVKVKENLSTKVFDNKTNEYKPQPESSEELSVQDGEIPKKTLVIDNSNELNSLDDNEMVKAKDNPEKKLLDSKNYQNNSVDSVINIKESVVNNPIDKNISIFDNILDLDNEKISAGITVTKDTILDVQIVDMPFNISLLTASSELSNKLGKTLGQDINKIDPDIYSYKNKFSVEKLENEEVKSINNDDNYVILGMDNPPSFSEENYEEFINNPINLQLISSFGQDKSNINRKVNLASIKDDSFVSVKRSENNTGSFISRNFNFINNKISEADVEQSIENKVYSFIVANNLPEKLNMVFNKLNVIKNNEFRQVKSKDLSNKPASINKVVIKKDAKENLDDISKRLLEKLENLQSSKTNNVTANINNIDEKGFIENIIYETEEVSNINLDSNQLIDNILEKNIEPILNNKENSYLAISSSSLFKNKYFANNLENTEVKNSNELNNTSQLSINNLESNKNEPKNINNSNLDNKPSVINTDVRKEKLFNRVESALSFNNSDNNQIKNNILTKSNISKNTILFENEIKNYITKNPDKNIFVGEISLSINKKLKKILNNNKFENIQIKSNKNIISDNLHKNIIDKLENRFEDKNINKTSIKKYETKTDKTENSKKDVGFINDKRVIENIGYRVRIKPDMSLNDNSVSQLTKNNFIGISIERIKEKTKKIDVFSKTMDYLLENKINNGFPKTEAKDNSMKNNIFNKFDSKLSKSSKENIINRIGLDIEHMDGSTQEYDETLLMSLESDLKPEKYNSDNNIENTILDEYNYVKSHESDLLQNILVNPSLYMPNLIKETNFDGNNIVDGDKKLFTLFSNNLTSEYPEIDLLEMTYEDTYHPQEMNIVNKEDYVHDFKVSKFLENKTNESLLIDSFEMDYDEIGNLETINDESVNIENDMTEDPDLNPLAVNNIATIIDSINNGVPIHFSEIPEIVKGVVNTIKNNKPIVINISLNPFNMGEMSMSFKLTEGNKMSISVETSTLAGHRSMESYFSSIKDIVKGNSLVLQEMVTNYSPDIKGNRKDKENTNSKFDNESSNSETGTNQQARRKKKRGKSEEKEDLKVDV